MAIKKVNFKLVIIIVLISGIFIFIPDTPNTIMDEYENCIKYYQNNEDEVKSLANYVNKIAVEYSIQPKMILSIILFELTKRNKNIRNIENSIISVFTYYRTNNNKWIPDLSIGIPQMKISTALWIKSKFENPSKNYIEYSNYDIYLIVKELNSNETAVIYVAEYLNYLLQKEKQMRLIENINYNEIENEHDNIARIASKYQGGVPLGSNVITKYGEIISMLSENVVITNY